MGFALFCFFLTQGSDMISLERDLEAVIATSPTKTL